MSQENVEVVRRNQDAWNRCDLRAWLASFRSDAELTGRAPEDRSRVSVFGGARGSK
ncbi:MAG: hypothetical protein AABM42_04945 [Actinomycetota bacterium]